MMLVQKIKDDENITIYEFNYLRLIISFIIYILIIIVVGIIFSKTNLLIRLGLIYLIAFIAIILISIEISKYSKDLKNKISQGYTMKYEWKNKLCSKTTITKIKKVN